MDERIEAFLKDFLVLEGEISKLLREDVRRYLAICEKQFRDDETNNRMKDRAAQACRTLCRMRVAEEIRRRKGTSTAEHLKVVLSIIDSVALFPMNDDYRQADGLPGASRWLGGSGSQDVDREAHVKTCPECNGDGVIEKDTDDEQQCPTCGGSGFVPDDDDDDEEVTRTAGR